MASVVDVYNLALSHLGVGKIVSTTTEQSEEALVCKVYFEIARDLVLRDFKWPFATRIVSLGLVEEQPNEEWSYSYRYPSDCLNFRKIQSGIRTDTNQSAIPYRVVSDTTGKLIYTDREDAIGEYTAAITDVNMFPVDFIMALSYRLAFYIAPRVTSGDPYGLQAKAMDMYLMEMGKATASAFNEETPDQIPDSEFVRIRE